MLYIYINFTNKNDISVKITLTRIFLIIHPKAIAKVNVFETEFFLFIKYFTNNKKNPIMYISKRSVQSFYNCDH